MSTFMAFDGTGPSDWHFANIRTNVRCDRRAKTSNFGELPIRLVLQSLQTRYPVT